MNIKLIFLLIFLFCNFFPLSSQNYSFSSYLPKVEKKADNLYIKIDTLTQEKDFYIYYRTEGLKNFQVRKMEKDKEGNVYYRLSKENLYGKKIEYFILESKNSVSDSISPVFTILDFTDKESPEIYFLGSGQASEDETGRKKNPLFFKVGASLSTSTQIHDDFDPPGEKFDANGNIRLYKNIYNEKYQFDFDTNFSYMHNVSDEESKINLSNMTIKFKKGAHSWEAGDLSINKTEFTTSSLSQRGLFYEMDGKTLYLSSFLTNSQQKTGFEGFGVPPSGAYIFGASAGVNIKTILKVRGLFVMGKDNLDSKTVSSTEDVFREGNLYSIWGELNLFESRLQLKGEFSRSNFGKAPDRESLEKKGDSAWRTEVDLNYGVLSAHVDYKDVGSDYYSIAYLFLNNDRKGLISRIGLTIKSFMFNVSFEDSKSNLSSVVEPMKRTKDIGADLTWTIANHFQLGGRFSLNNLDYDKSTGLETGSEDMDTIEYSGSLGYIAGSNSITLNIGKRESKNFDSNITASLALSLRFGNIFSLNPTLTYQSNEDFSDNTTSKIYSAYLSSEISFIPEIFSLSISGSWTKTDNTDFDSTVLSAGGNLNLYLAKIFKNKIQPTLSLRGKYEDYKNGSNGKSNVAVYLQADISF